MCANYRANTNSGPTKPQHFKSTSCSSSWSYEGLAVHRSLRLQMWPSTTLDDTDIDQDSESGCVLGGRWAKMKDSSRRHKDHIRKIGWEAPLRSILHWCAAQLSELSEWNEQHQHSATRTLPQHASTSVCSRLQQHYFWSLYSSRNQKQRWDMDLETHKTLSLIL